MGRLVRRTETPPRLTLYQAVEAFLGMHFNLDDPKTMRTQRDAREEAARIVGFTQAQEHLRNILSQVKGAGRNDAHILAEVRSEGQLRPEKMGDTNLWVPPELPVRRR